jgi:hypothetical protein
MRPLSLTALLVLATTAPAAPNLGDRPPKWEYSELSYRTSPGRAATVDADGKEVPAVPASIAIKWVTPAGEVDVKGWDELIAKLKAPALKKGSANYTRLQILNCLGGEGWELVEQHTTGATASGPAFGDRGPGLGVGRGRDDGAARDRGFGGPGSFSPPATTWLFKRRVP